MPLLPYDRLVHVYNNAPGLNIDKLKTVLLYAWERLRGHGPHKVVFAYDEAQCLSDNPRLERYPLTLLLHAFNSLQKQGVMFLLVLAGLPPLEAQLFKARANAERMVRFVPIGRLNEEASREAVIKPTERYIAGHTIFMPETVDTILRRTGGTRISCISSSSSAKRRSTSYIRQLRAGHGFSPVPFELIQHKLDEDFFEGRWGRISERQRDLLRLVVHLGAEDEFSAQEIADASKELPGKAFSESQVIQILGRLSEVGMAYRSRRGRYSLAVPMLEDYIRRTYGELVKPAATVEDA